MSYQTRDECELRAWSVQRAFWKKLCPQAPGLEILTLFLRRRGRQPSSSATKGLKEVGVQPTRELWKKTQEGQQGSGQEAKSEQ